MQVTTKPYYWYIQEGRIMIKKQSLKDKDKILHIADVIASTEFEKDLKKAIEEGNEVGYNEGGAYGYYCESTALTEVLKVIKKHLL